MTMAKLIFDLNDESDNQDFKTMSKANNFAMALVECKNVLRQKLKYGTKNDTEDEIYVEMQDKFFEILEEYDINISDLL